jgi:hypothetical protein
MGTPFSDQADREWRTWRQVCKQLAKLGIDVNDPKNEALVLAIRLWGDEAHLLDVENADPRERERREDLRAKYGPHVLDEWNP